jgi:hypothetical protein
VLNQICSRRYGLKADDTFDMVCAKVEARTPYMSTWGEEGVSADTAEAAAEIWNAKKKEEREEDGGGEEAAAGEDREKEPARKRAARVVARSFSRTAAYLKNTALNNWDLLKDDRCVNMYAAALVGIGGVALGYYAATRRLGGGKAAAAAAAAAGGSVLPALPALPELPSLPEGGREAAIEGVRNLVERIRGPLQSAAGAAGKHAGALWAGAREGVVAGLGVGAQGAKEAAASVDVGDVVAEF